MQNNNVGEIYVMPIQYVVLIITGIVMGIATLARCYLICCFQSEN